MHRHSFRSQTKDFAELAAELAVGFDIIKGELRYF